MLSTASCPYTAAQQRRASRPQQLLGFPSNRCVLRSLSSVLMYYRLAPPRRSSTLIISSFIKSMQEMDPAGTPDRDSRQFVQIKADVRTRIWEEAQWLDGALIEELLEDDLLRSRLRNIDRSSILSLRSARKKLLPALRQPPQLRDLRVGVSQASCRIAHAA